MEKKMQKSLAVSLLALALTFTAVSAKAEETKGSASFWDKTKVTGQFNSSYNWNFNNPICPAGICPGVNATRVFDTRHDSFDFNLAEVALETQANDWAKFRLDLDFGQDVPLVTGAYAAPGAAALTSGMFGVQQAYVDLTAPVGKGLTFRLGHFVTQLGYEVIESAYNWNTSRSLLFGFAIPFTHTGILATYPFSDKFSASLGIVNGWDVVVDNNKGKTFLTQFVYKPMDKLTLSLQGTVGPEQAPAPAPAPSSAAANSNMRGIVDFVATWNATDQLTLGFNYDFGKERGVGGTGIPNWQGGALYAHYKPFDFVGLTVRGEIFNDDGSRIAAPAIPAVPAGTTYAEGTGTLHLYLADGWETRFEFRHDQADNPVFTRSTGLARHFQDTVSSEVVYSF